MSDALMLTSVLMVMLTSIVATVAGYFLFAYTDARRDFDRRLATLGADERTRELVRRSALFQFGDVIDRTRVAHRTERALQQADMHLRPSEWYAITLLVGVVLYFVLWFVFGLSMRVNVVLGFIGALSLTRIYLNFRRNHYLNTFNAQMPDVALLLANSLKAGLSVPQGFNEIVEKMAQPASDEFARLGRDIRLGVSVAEAMDRMLERVPSDEVRVMFTTIAIQRQAGGNLSKALAITSDAISARHRLSAAIDTMTAESRYIGVVLLIVPIIVLALLNRMMPDSVTNFLSNPIGWVVIGVFALIQVIAFVLIRRVNDIKV